uniref:PRMT5 oligomerisation domain-containing protein n=1 Tax=Lutzomyia longipalpis TaxID=7200 RepID=A0A1B0CTZ8_LUTLO
MIFFGAKFENTPDVICNEHATCNNQSQTPVNLKAGEEIELNVWRHVAQRKVWYEWSLTSPQISPIYNLNGRACDILM